MRTVFLGSPPFATPVLDALLASSHKPLAIVTPPERPRGRGRAVSESAVAERARAADIPLLRPESARDPAFLDELRALAPETGIVASYGEILTAEFLSLAPRGWLNVHASLLPRHRGASPIQAAILAGDSITGVSVQRIVLELDAGDVLLSLETPIGERDTAGELAARLAVLGGEAAVLALDRLERGTATFTPQDPSAVTHCRKIKKAHGVLDWTRGADELGRFARAMSPWPGAHTALPDGRMLSALEVEPRSLADVGAIGAEDAEPGELLECGPRLVVACGPRLGVAREAAREEGSALELVRVQLAGKRALAAEEFLRGAHLSVGERLGAPRRD